jgi:aminopeptidase
MKILKLTTASLLVAATTGSFISVVGQDSKPGQSRSYDELARRIVSTSAAIQAGDVVVISGGQHNIPLMEALAIETQKAGGLATIFLNTDKVSRSLNVDVPEQYLEQEPRYLAEWFKHIDVFIGLPSIEDDKAVNADVPEARNAKRAKAGQVVDNMLNDSRVRAVFVGYPAKEHAANVHLDFATYEKMHWAAVNADYKQISKKGDALKKLLQGAKNVRVTSPNGTDVTFSVGDRPIFVDDGIVTKEEAKSKLAFNRFATLPGGSIFLAPLETSANGKVVVPKHQCRFAPLTDVSLDFKNGKMQNFKAGQGADCFKETMEPYQGPKDMFGGFSIGLNPAKKVMEEGADYRPDSAAGMVTISIGDNRLAGGQNDTPGGYNFPITKATVAIDGKVVVKDGQLVL